MMMLLMKNDDNEQRTAQLLHLMMTMTNEEASVATFIQPGPVCQEASAHCSRVPVSRMAQGGAHSSISQSCSLVGIGAPAQQQERRIPSLAEAGEEEWGCLGRSLGGAPDSPLCTIHQLNMSG